MPPREDAIADASPAAAPGFCVSIELQRVILEMPDAVERLAYVGRKTETAATEVLNLVDEAKAANTTQATRSEELIMASRNLLASADFDLARAKMVIHRCAELLAQSVVAAREQDERLTRIMLAQDFQDLTGQVIGKVCNILATAEEHLRHVQSAAHLKESGASGGGQLAGVQVPEKALQQTDVDDLLAELGF